MRFAFIFICQDLGGVERTSVRGGDNVFIGVRDVDEGCSEVVRLVNDGIGCIELCGAFGVDGCRRVIEATGGTIPVGYITHPPEMDAAYARAFGTD